MQRETMLLDEKGLSTHLRRKAHPPALPLNHSASRRDSTAASEGEYITQGIEQIK